MESHKYDWHLRMTKETMGVESQTASGLREKFGSRKGLDYTRIFKHAPGTAALVPMGCCSQTKHDFGLIRERGLG